LYAGEIPEKSIFRLREVSTIKTGNVSGGYAARIGIEAKIKLLSVAVRCFTLDELSA
jgi:hypothetical protein